MAATLDRPVSRLGADVQGSSPEVPRLHRVLAWLGPARLAAVGLAGGLQLAAPPNSPVARFVFVAAFAYAGARLLARRPRIPGALADVAAAAVAVGLTGGESSPYMGFGLVASLQAGLVIGMRGGAAASLVVSIASLPHVVASFTLGALVATQAAAWVGLFPLLALTAGLSARIWRLDASERSGLLVEANRVLSSLYRIARSVPGGLEVGTVVSSALDDLRSLGAPAGAVFVAESNVVSLVGSFGLAPADRTVTDANPETLAVVRGSARAVDRRDLPPPIRGLLDSVPSRDCWIVCPLRHGGADIGLVLAACWNHRGEGDHSSARVVLDHIARETSVAIENARLFARVRRLSVDEERRRLARELHDGVAQALTHVRMELEFLARHGAQKDPDMQREASRLARVVQRAGDEVRSAIDGLRSATGRDGLAQALHSYLSDLAGLVGPKLAFRSSGDCALPPHVELETFRIAQEAVSNAVRHSKGTRVDVHLATTADVLRLSVRDDGRGLTDTTRGVGLGLSAMRERADRLGAVLTVAGGESGGTLVEFVLTDPLQHEGSSA